MHDVYGRIDIRDSLPDLTSSSFAGQFDGEPQVSSSQQMLPPKALTAAHAVIDPRWPKSQEVTGSPTLASAKEGGRPAPTVSNRSEVVPVQDPVSARRNGMDEALARRILRTHVADQVLCELRGLAATAKTPASAMYADGLLRTIRATQNIISDDPYLQVLLALHDALAYENRWCDYSAEQYATATEFMKGLARQQDISVDRMQKAIGALENMGFDTLPFEVDFSDGDSAVSDEA